MTYEKVTTLGELWDGEMKCVAVQGKYVLLVHVDGAVRAYEDRCVHQDVPLSEGKLEDGKLVCRAHGWCFDAKTGRGVNPEGPELRRVPLKVEGEDVLVEVHRATSRLGPPRSGA